MEKISIFNYEAYYLDLLEGNLSEEDTALLLDFLEQHPHLKLDHEFMPELDLNEMRLDSQFKAELKQVDFENETPNLINAEQFIIAETEGLLSPDKSLDLNDLLKQNEQLQKLHRIYHCVQLKPDERLIFGDKESLKHKATLRLWPAIAFAAAASVAAFFFLIQPGNMEVKGNAGFSGIAGVPEIHPNLKPVSTSNVQFVDPSGNPLTRFVVNSTVSDGALAPKNTTYSINDMALRSPRALKLEIADLDLIENQVAQESYEQRYPKNDYTVLGVQDMNNPIKPITNRIGDLVKQDVDFRTAKATEKNSGGFYIKIGKFELSHKKH